MLIPSIVGRKSEVLEKAKWIFTPAHVKELSSWAKVDSLPLYISLPNPLPAGVVLPSKKHLKNVITDE